MIPAIEPHQLSDHPLTSVIDVRSPSEFSKGHIPGALNIPLFDDNERALIGTRYNHAGKEAGFMLGLEIAGPKISSYVKKLNRLVPVRSPLILYCWRGGMRSLSMAWLFYQAGHEVKLIKGGYKAFRSFIRRQIVSRQFRVIGGLTGAGKTHVLHLLKDMDQQIIDLEAIACHKGSVFGHMGQHQQPSNEQFEITLWHHLQKLNPLQPVFIEDESRSIGKVSLPEEFYQTLQHSPMFMLESNMNERVKRLISEYGFFDRDEIILNIDKLRKYLGGEAHQKITDAMIAGDLETAVEILLRYYDRKYTESINRKPQRLIIPVNGCAGDGRSVAQSIINLISPVELVAVV